MLAALIRMTVAKCSLGTPQRATGGPLWGFRFDKISRATALTGIRDAGMDLAPLGVGQM
jgi:hypothetical protein